MTEIFFKNRKVHFGKLLDFGFIEREDGFFYSADIVDGQMKLSVVVKKDGRIFSEVVDNADGEEYVLHRIPEAAGTFVGRVKGEYEAVLKEIDGRCFETEVFKSEQAKKLIEYVRDVHGDALEYLWKKFPDNAVWRRKDNRKWYGAVLTVSRRKLGFDSDESVEILDLRIKPEEMEGTVDLVRYFPGYHMNKKNWITVCLDGTVALEEICNRLEESYLLAK